jgi:hypothetical protein
LDEMARSRTPRRLVVLRVLMGVLLMAAAGALGAASFLLFRRARRAGCAAPGRAAPRRCMHAIHAAAARAVAARRWSNLRAPDRYCPATQTPGALKHRHCSTH